MVVIEPAALELLFSVLREKGYRLVGPTIRDNTIVLDELSSPADLPIGWQDTQQPGAYRLHRTEKETYFNYVVGPQSFKKYLHEPRLTLFKAIKDGHAFDISTPEDDPPAYAFIGIRACELAAIAIQDKVFLESTFTDPHYKSRREKIFTVAVNCTRPGANCFCTSWGTGPETTEGYDLVLTEIATKDTHVFLIKSGSPQGKEVLEALPYREADNAMLQKHQELMDHAAQSITKHLETDGLKDLFYQNLESPHWETVAQRCLSCANCTMVCPTCFCTTVEDVTNLTGTEAERVRRWDSCFTADFSYIHGGSIRKSTASRYRQWITHKLASWQDQFGTSGCVGCGRCITWCPVGIDITEEAAALRKKHLVES